MIESANKSLPLGWREEPSLELWKQLYTTARLFYNQSPWEALSNSELFALLILFPAKAILLRHGNGGMEFGLLAYRGEIGLGAVLTLKIDVEDAIRAS